MVELRVEEVAGRWQVTGQVREAGAQWRTRRETPAPWVAGDPGAGGPVAAVMSVVPRVVRALGVPLADEGRLAERAALLQRWTAEDGGEGELIPG